VIAVAQRRDATGIEIACAFGIIFFAFCVAVANPSLTLPLSGEGIGAPFDSNSEEAANFPPDKGGLRGVRFFLRMIIKKQAAVAACVGVTYSGS